jgi:phosphate transport system substrate-binding protein
MKHIKARYKVLLITAILALILSGCAAAEATSPLRTATAQSTPSSSATQTGTTKTPGPVNPSIPITVLETGSSLLYPLFNQWAPAIKQAYPNLTVETASTGSGTGIAQAVSGVVQIGASDAYMSDSQVVATPGIVNIPLAISAQQINFNLPGISSLNLSGTVLAGIFTGTIRYWDDPAIKADNPNVNLPNELIIPIHRTDGSGDTFIFTQYLSDSDANWNNSIGYNTSINWPAVQGAIGAVGNSGVVQTLAQTPYSIGYVGISFLDQANSKGLGTAALKNQAGEFVLPTAENITAAASAMVPNTPADERISLVFAPGVNSYPIINYEYAIVQTHQSNPVMASAIRTVLLWAISTSGGSSASFLDTVHFLPLPGSVVSKSEVQINQIQ